MPGGACSFAQPTRLRLVLPSSPRVERSLRLPDGAVVVEGASSAFPEEGGTGSGRGGSSEGVEVGTGGGVGVALVNGAIAAAFRFTFHLFQRPCMGLLRALGPWLTRYENCYQWRKIWVVNLNGGGLPISP
jgi:hypothetical protein